MRVASTEPYRKLAKLFQALSHPARLRILQLLSDEEHCVCHLTAVLRKRQPYVSQQLMILRDAGLVVDRKDGLMVYYRLPSPHVLDLIETMTGLLRAQGVDVELLPVPKSPVKGCPCPKCSAEAERVT
jgi:DNA-binding transcriptional ArsR family regulator